MRQFVFGIVVAAFLWWGYGSWFGEAPAVPPAGATGDATAAPGLAPSSPAPLGNTNLSEVLGSRPAPAVGSALAATPAEASAVVTELLPNLAPHDGAVGDVAALDRAWSALAVRGQAQLAAADRRRLAEALGGTAGDFATQLAQLGSHNTFLHSGEGRAQAGKVLAAGMALADADAVAAGSLLLALCLRGSIEKVDTEARAFVDAAYQQHRVRADRWLCDPANVAGARTYTVGPGDSLGAIAKRFRKDKVLVDDGTIAVLNRIHNANAILPGQKLKIPVDPVTAVVEKRSFSLAVMVGSNLLRLYWVGHGENDKTPVTEFTVLEKIEHPPWDAPDGNRYPYGHPKNILGEYFIKFRHDSYTGFGAHGTPMPDTIGTMSSAGCIRMLAPDIAELFKILPRGAKVVIKAS